MVKPRDNYWDLVKGFAIIGVVSIHFIGGNYADVWTYFVRQFVSMAVFFSSFSLGTLLARRSVGWRGFCAIIEGDVGDWPCHILSGR